MSIHRLVTNENLETAVEDIYLNDELGLDTESYGVDFDDEMFALQISTEKNTWYFNLLNYHDGTPYLHRESLALLSDSFKRENKVWFIHNAKFDLRRLGIFDLHLEGEVHCTQTAERFIYNEYMFYSLDACLQRRKLRKDDAVEKYISDNKLWTDIILYGQKVRRKHYDKVPFDIMFNYGCLDAERVRILGKDQRKELLGKIFYHGDCQLQKACYEMEEVGIKCDTQYAQGGLEYEKKKAEELSRELSALAGQPFRNGPIWLCNTFDKFEIKYARNPKTGNPIFNEEALNEINHPIAEKIKQYRKHDKFASTYYGYYVHRERVHANIKTGAVRTMRFSYEDPNLQNVPKEKKLAPEVTHQVRGCFVPDSDEYVFVPIDYNQQEFRMFLDYCGEMELIRKINNHGMDAHDATAELCGIDRDPAKTVNFALIYGVGDAELSLLLGMSPRDTAELKKLYFSRLPKAKQTLRSIMDRSVLVGHIKTWTGRKMFLPKPITKDGKIITFEYKMPNRLIQGGCADVIRLAMPQIRDLLRPYKSHMKIQVHDELLMQFHKSELDLIDPVVEIMENIYKPFSGMKLTCGVDHSWKSWGKRDIRSGKPTLT